MANQKATKDVIYEWVKDIRQERYEEESKTSENPPKKLTGKAELKAEIEDVFKAIKELLLDGYDVPLTDVGTLKNKVRNARKGRNPQSGAEIEIAGRRAIGYTESKFFKDTFKSE